MSLAPPSTPYRPAPTLGTPLPAEFERLARAWLRWIEGDPGAHAADAALRRAVDASPTQAWMIVGRLLELAGSRETRARVGAGPLEWMMERHGDSLNALLHGAVARRPEYREAFEAACPRRG